MYEVRPIPQSVVFLQYFDTLCLYETLVYVARDLCPGEGQGLRSPTASMSRTVLLTGNVMSVLVGSNWTNGYHVNMEIRFSM